MRIYFDHAATSPIRFEVQEFLSNHENLKFYNPSSVHVEGGKMRKDDHDCCKGHELKSRA